MTFDINLVPDGGISWLDASGPDGNIVLSTRVRLARNIDGQRFTVRSSPEDNPPRIVAAERENPGHSARHWASPIPSACFMLTEPSSCVVTRSGKASTSRINSAPTIKASATVAG